MASTGVPDSGYSIVSLPSDGETIDAADVNTDIQGLTDKFNAHTHDSGTILAAAYPVGSIFISAVSTNPATLLGFGTWSAFGAGKTLVGIDSTDTAFDTVEETGGSKTTTVQHVHSGPNHTHSTLGGDSVCFNNDQVSACPSNFHTLGADTGQQASTNAGGTQNTGNMSTNTTPSIVQPYIVTYFWKRTA